ncbi:MAG: DUF6496 domain-containing protein [Kofleriaceae bacterium]
MPEKKVKQRAKRDLRAGKAPSTAAGEFVREEIDHVREGKHGARSPRQAIAIGLSKARRAGVPLPPPRSGATSAATRKRAERDYEVGQGQGKGQGKGKSKSKPTRRASPKRRKASTRALQREPKRAGSRSALASQAREAAARRRRTQRKRR